mmetsp:Transcript_10731/g.15695  ORF Transcript_10731/g.15695 Transcript_10731/m.15695 type:complete len:110 (-) Transcript_10731:365-694(-)
MEDSHEKNSLIKKLKSIGLEGLNLILWILKIYTTYLIGKQFYKRMFRRVGPPRRRSKNRHIPVLTLSKQEPSYRYNFGVGSNSGIPLFPEAIVREENEFYRSLFNRNLS